LRQDRVIYSRILFAAAWWQILMRKPRRHMHINARLFSAWDKGERRKKLRSTGATAREKLK